MRVLDRLKQYFAAVAARWKTRRSLRPGELALSKWFVVRFDDERVTLDVHAPGHEAWTDHFHWANIVRVYFKPEYPTSDGVYVFTSTRPQSYAIPMEADGGAALWNELVRRELFDAELAITAMGATEGLFCWPLQGELSQQADSAPPQQNE